MQNHHTIANLVVLVDIQVLAVLAVVGIIHFGSQLIVDELVLIVVLDWHFLGLIGQLYQPILGFLVLSFIDRWLAILL